jgi:hypothetical protein
MLKCKYGATPKGSGHSKKKRPGLPQGHFSLHENRLPETARHAEVGIGMSFAHCIFGLFVMKPPVATKRTTKPA